MGESIDMLAEAVYDIWSSLTQKLGRSPQLMTEHENAIMIRCRYILEKLNVIGGNKKEKRDVGVWNFIGFDVAACSNCGGLISTHYENTNEAVEKWKELYPYCPFCGTKKEYAKPRLNSDEKKGSEDV